MSFCKLMPIISFLKQSMIKGNIKEKFHLIKFLLYKKKIITARSISSVFSIRKSEFSIQNSEFRIKTFSELFLNGCYDFILTSDLVSFPTCFSIAVCCGNRIGVLQDSSTNNDHIASFVYNDLFRRVILLTQRISFL